MRRDRFTCQTCGAVSGDPHQDNGQKTRIQVGRILAKSMGGDNEPSNLRAICSVCQAGLRNLILDRPSLQQLLIQVRRATGADQLKVLRWLITKYPVQAAMISGETTEERSQKPHAKPPPRQPKSDS